MEEHKDDAADETLSLSDLQMEEPEDTTTTASEVVINQSFYEEFFGFSINNSNTISPTVSPKPPVIVKNDNNVRKKKAMANPMFRSTSASFKYMRLKITSTTTTWRSKSAPSVEKNRLAASKSKSKWQILLPGLGSGKFPKKMDLSDIKSRQLRGQISVTDCQKSPAASSVDHGGSGAENGGGERSRKQGWWRFVDVLGCGGGYVRDTKVVV
ncbi:hypothetical protein OSB04_026450 [Centaurea solstitialis]|uniref:Uncharacterized protein n=1 Tax=Centaurea solstitialis TaxID=347529 RepID=A0AA38W793_9ASTR|nr:hypothetical protein OSB04_026450 [Centaurea solstitialis]